MPVDPRTQGDRIRSLFSAATGSVTIVAPFIKRKAFHSLLEVIPSETEVRCVTRWLPREVASGVSDPEIIDDLEQREAYSLTLVDSLHAKLYIAGEKCLAGSSNVTNAGLGDADESNIEVLVATSACDQGIQATLAAIAEKGRPATQQMAATVRRLAASLSPSPAPDVEPSVWFPRSRRAHDAYRLYSRPASNQEYLSLADRLLLSDLANANIPPGLGEDEFRVEMQELLQTIPLANTLLETEDDLTLTKADAQAYLTVRVTKEIQPNDLWTAFVNWMVCYYPRQVMKQEITEIALRRARLIH